MIRAFLRRITHARAIRKAREELDYNLFAQEITAAAIADMERRHGPVKHLRAKYQALRTRQLELEMVK